MKLASHRNGFALGAAMILAFGLVVTTGCGDDGLEGVTGVVTMDGEPLEGAAIEFVPTGTEGSPSYGKTDSSGNFKMEFSSSATGVVPGEYQVSISTFDVADPDNDIPGKKERVPSKYRGENSELIVTVKEGEQNHFEFDIESEGEVEQPEVDPDS